MAIKHDVTEKGLGKTKTGTAIYVKGNLRYLTTKPKLKYASEEREFSVQVEFTQEDLEFIQDLGSSKETLVKAKTETGRKVVFKDDKGRTYINFSTPALRKDGEPCGFKIVDRRGKPVTYNVANDAEGIVKVGIFPFTTLDGKKGSRTVLLGVQVHEHQEWVPEEKPSKGFEYKAEDGDDSELDVLF